MLLRVAAPVRERLDALEQQLSDARTRLAASRDHAGHLTDTLRAARDQLAALRDEVERLSAPPHQYASVVEVGDDGLVTVTLQGRELRVACSDAVDPDELAPGRQVLLNEASNVIAVARFDERGQLLTVVDLVGEDRLLVQGHGDDDRVVALADPLRATPPKPGDTVLVDVRGHLALERISRPEMERLVLEEVPDVTYADIGGLADQVEAIRDAVELPYLHPDLFAEHELDPPKGILLYGPPGCGKTMIAKAVANALAQRVSERRGGTEVRSFFLNVKGPELLNKYVGETERQLRLVFQRAREKAAEGFPVIIFFDEMESLFRTRGSGVSSDMETTIVPQLLAEIDGVESLRDVVIIGASNREDMIDPAILRPGRLDVKIKVARPDADAAREIFGLYLPDTLPLDADEVSGHGGDRAATTAAMVDRVVDKMYADDPDNRFLEVTYANGDRETLYFRDFNSGAMINNIVARAKKSAIKRFLDTGTKGLTTEDLLEAIREEFRENEDLPNTTNPDDWARISALKGERITYVRTLTSEGGDTGKSIDTISPGQYL
ncbi:proteasome ATPase [Nitriliruptoria bacterium AS10]|nr:proteasome ATPase [Salsipaludibacter albus]MBY5161661.1 proteasome ATPase [Salsipaludibacter albus]